MAQIAVIINGRAGVLVGGNGEPLLDRIRQAFADEGVDVDMQVRTGKQIGQAIDAAVQGESDRIIVGGGDGTVNTAAAAVARAGKILGILPMGTLNLYAQDLGIPLDPAEAARVLIHGEVRPVDYAEIEGRLYLCNSIIGIIPSLMREREKQRGESFPRRLRGVIQTAYNLFMRDPCLRIELDTGGKREMMEIRGMAVCNNGYHNAFALFPEPVTLDAGKLGVYFAREPTRLGTLLLSARLLLGTWKKEPDLLEFKVEQVSINTRRRKMTVVTDGEILDIPAPLNYRIVPRGLRVIMPPETAARLRWPADSESSARP